MIEEAPEDATTSNSGDGNCLIELAGSIEASERDSHKAKENWSDAQVVGIIEATEEKEAKNSIALSCLLVHTELSRES